MTDTVVIGIVLVTALGLFWWWRRPVDPLAVGPLSRTWLTQNVYQHRPRGPLGDE